MHAAGQLLPALQAALERPVPLPAAVSTAQAAAAAGAVALAGALLAWLLVWRRPSPTYLLDFECYRPGAWAAVGAGCEEEQGRCAVCCGQSRAACAQQHAPAEAAGAAIRHALLFHGWRLLQLLTSCANPVCRCCCPPVHPCHCFPCSPAPAPCCRRPAQGNVQPLHHRLPRQRLF